MIRMNFKKIYQLKKTTSKKMRYYGFLSLVFLIFGVIAILPSSIEFFILISFFDVICWGLFAWNLFTYRTLTILESVTEKTD